MQEYNKNDLFDEKIKMSGKKGNLEKRSSQ